MAEDGVSRVVDFGGGERVVAEFVRDLPLAEFCRSQGIRLVSAYFLGPDMEDFEHVVRITRSGDLAAENVPLVPNEGVIQQGQTTLGAFDPILAHPDFEALLKAGARAAVLTRLACMRRLREDGLGFYRTAYPSAGTRPASATMQHMTAAWIERHEAALAEESAVGWLP
jgi:hypothetical protein